MSVDISMCVCRSTEMTRFIFDKERTISSKFVKIRQNSSKFDNFIKIRMLLSVIHLHVQYGVALVSRIDGIIGLFCKRALQTRQYSAEETYNLIDPTDRSHPIAVAHTQSHLHIFLHTYLHHTYIQHSNFRILICGF